jgi:hypothetical protein
MAGELVKIEHAAPAQRRSFDEIMRMAETIAKSRLFGVTQVDQVVALMLMAEAEGRHVASAMQDYSVIQGKPSLKAEAMLARFQQAGGKVKWTELSDTRVAAIFSHSQCEPVEIDWDMQRARMAGLGGKDMWKKFPRQMLRARVISEGVRTAFPGALGGMYAPEEVIDFEQPTRSPPPTPARGQLAASEEPGQVETPREPALSEHDGEEVDQSTQPEWGILLAMMDSYSTREELKAWWTTPEKKELKQKKPHLMRAFYRFAYMPRWEELGETVEWTDEAGARG